MEGNEYDNTMKPNHTPGPWLSQSVKPNYRLMNPKPESYVTAGPIDAPGNRIVAVVHHVDGSNSEANARLIAAAPDLFEFLQNVQSFWESGGKAKSRWAHKVRAAIARATLAMDYSVFSAENDSNVAAMESSLRASENLRINGTHGPGR